MGTKKKDKIPLRDAGFEGGSSALFAGLSLPSADEAEQPSDEPAHVKGSAAQPSPSESRGLLSPLGPKRLLRLSTSKAGRGGKLVTQLKTLEHSTSLERERLAKAAGRALGCRAWVEGELIYLQGDQRERLSAWVTAQS